MSTEITNNIDVTLDSVDVSKSDTQHTVETNNECLDLVIPESLVEGYKKEYAIVGDGFFASVSEDEAPQWLLTLIDNVVANAVSGGLTDYDVLVQDVRNAIDSIDVAKNTYVEQIDITSIVDGIVASRLATLNATYEANYATKVELDTTLATETQVLAQSIEDLDVSFGDNLNARATQITQAYADADQVLADDITALTVVYTNQQSELDGAANAVATLQTYVGIPDGVPDGTGILADIDALKKQVDGSIDVFIGTHDVMVVDTNDQDGLDTNELLANQWPYVLWTPMSGTVDPTDTTRIAYKGVTPDSYPIESNTVYHNTTANTFWIYDASVTTWSEILEAQYNTFSVTNRELHLLDTYIKYQVDAQGVNQYLDSFKFIKTDVDTSSPYVTDTEGYGWALITTSDSQAAYLQSLNAYALADSKVTVFFGIQATVNPGTAEYMYYFNNGVLYKTADGTIVIPNEGDQLTVKVIDGDAIDYYLYTYYGNNWVLNTADGLISTARWAVDLDSYLGGRVGNEWGGETSLVNKVETTARGEIVSAFSYNSTLTDGAGSYYDTGFGLESSTQTGTGTQLDPFTSEFWIRADKLRLVDPDNPANSAVFTVTPGGGVTLGLDYTEATRNIPQGTWSSETSYITGDIVQHEGGSFIAVGNSLGVTPNDDGVNWRIMAVQGTIGYDGDIYREVILYTNSSSVPVSVPTAAEGFNTLTGDAAATGVWSGVATTPSSNENTYRIHLTVKQAQSTGPWVAVDASWSTPLQVTASNGVSGTSYREIFLYANGTSAPGLPAISGSFNATTGSASNTGLWTISPSTPTSGAYTWRTSLTIQQIETVGDWTAVDAAWNTAIKMSGIDGISYIGTTEYYARQTSITIPDRYAPNSGTTVATRWSTTPYLPDSTYKFIFNWSRNFRSDGSFNDSEVSLISQYSEDGRGIASITEAYQLSANAIDAPTGTWYSSISSAGQISETYPYLWNRTTTNYTTGSPTYRYNLIAARGNNGDPGAPGVSFTGSTEYYKLTNTTAFPTRYSTGTTIASGWTTTPQIPTSSNQYLWNFNRNAKSDSTFYDSEVSLVTQYVEDGRGIVSITELYQRGTSPTIEPTGTWYNSISGAGALSESYPYLWNKTTTAYTTGSPSSVVTLIAARGDNGLPGVSYAGTSEYYKLTTTNIAPAKYSSGTTIASGWSTSASTPTTSYRYLWNFNRNSKTDGTFNDSDVSLVTQYVEDGRGISSIVEEYLIGTSGTTPPIGTWQPTIALAGALTAAVPYMWNRTTINYTSGSPTVTTTLIAARGSDGVSYTGSQEYYALSSTSSTPNRYSTGTTINTTTWKTTPQIPTSTYPYLWNFNRNSKSDGTYSDSLVSLITQYVEDGRGISAITEAYQRGTSATTAPTGTWYTSVASAGALSSTYPYLWNRTTTTYTSGNPTYVTTLIAARGADGAQGPQGPQGATGATGPAGATGARGSAVQSYSANLGSTTPTAVSNTSLKSYWNNAGPSNLDNEQVGDVLILTNTSTTAGWTHIYKCTTGGTYPVWSSSTALTVNGNMVVQGTLAANALASGTLLNSVEMKSTGFVQGSSGWRIKGNGDAEFNTLTVQSGQVSGILMPVTALNFYSGLYVRINFQNPVSTANGPFYLGSTGTNPYYYIHLTSIPANTVPQKLACVVGAIAQASSVLKDFEVIVLANYTISGNRITSYQQIGRGLSTGTYAINTVAVGSSTATFSGTTNIAVLVGGNNCDWTVQHVYGLIWGIR